jgi:hypothetical protein
MAGACRPRLPRSTLLRMTAWIALFAVTVLFTLALRHGRSKEPRLPPGYDGDRQLAELNALTSAAMTAPLP